MRKSWMLGHGDGPCYDVFGAGQAIGGVAAAAGTIGAASIQANAEQTAAQDQLKAAQEANTLQQTEFNTQQSDIAPWLQAGQGALSELSAGTAPGGNLLSTYPGGQFTAPTEQQAEQTPGYQFQLDQGLQALQRAQASTGTLGGASEKEALQYGEGLASENYQNVYNNALNTYGTNYNAWNTNQTNQFNRLASVAGIGQNANNQLLSAGTNYANESSSNLLGAGNSAAAGTIATGNTIGGAINSLASIPTIYGTAPYQNGSGYGAPSYAGVDPYSGIVTNPNPNIPTWDPSTGQEAYS